MLRLAAEVGLVRVGLVALDSTRIEANASAGANRSIDWIRDEVDKIIKEARTTDDEEDRRSAPSSGDDIPAELVDPGSRLARLRAAKARLEDDAARRQAAYEARPPTRPSSGRGRSTRPAPARA